MLKENSYLTTFDTYMQHAVDALAQEFQGIRTNRASVGLLEPLRVEVYGSSTPIQQVSTITTPDARTIVVQVWDKSATKAVEKAIRESDLGLNPAVDGQTIRIAMPVLTEERRHELTKVAAKYAEESKVSVRNTRRDAMDWIKKSEKNGEITEDDVHRMSDEVQKITDRHIKEIDTMLEKKQRDIMIG
ncbi:MAG: ribosome recycling factor [Holosporales bacterium]|jgi:ribosome recycling factor|nr:ribosome recycling factor [Holosporales bacterium]